MHRASPKMNPLRDKAYCRSAQNRHCMVRDPDTGDFCNGEGVVLAHIREDGNAGMGMKPPDDESLFLCAKHHDEMDGRRPRGAWSAAEWRDRNVFIPERKAAYRRYKSGTGR